MIKTVLFDLDGTITDSKIGILNSVEYALEKLNISKSKVGDLNKFIGPPLHKSFEKFCNLSEYDSKNAVEMFREYFREKGIVENSLFPNIEKTLKDLKKDNYNLIIATSKPLKFAKIVISNFKLDKIFSNIYGGNMDGSFTDKSEIISKIISDKDLKRDETIMVGDRSFDATGANNNKIPFVWAKYGYGKEEEMIDCKIDFTIDKSEDLLQVLRKMIKV